MGSIEFDLAPQSHSGRSIFSGEPPTLSRGYSAFVPLRGLQESSLQLKARGFPLPRIKLKTPDLRGTGGFETKRLELQLYNFGGLESFRALGELKFALL